MIHSLADCKINVPDSTNIWQYVVVLEGAEVGENCNVCAHCLLEHGSKIGNNVTLKCGVYLWDGVEIEDNVFVGPNATFTNNKYPRSKQDPDVHPKTILKKGCSIGANATIICGVTIGENAMVGAGSVVTKDVPSGELWVGNPAIFVRKISE